MAQLGTRKKRVRPKSLRVYWQNAGMCSTCGRFAGTHGGVLDVHTEGVLSPLSFALSISLSPSLSPSSFLIPVPLALALALPFSLSLVRLRSPSFGSTHVYIHTSFSRGASSQANLSLQMPLLLTATTFVTSSSAIVGHVNSWQTKYLPTVLLLFRVSTKQPFSGNYYIVQK